MECSSLVLLGGLDAARINGHQDGSFCQRADVGGVELEGQVFVLEAWSSKVLSAGYWVGRGIVHGLRAHNCQCAHVTQLHYLASHMQQAVMGGRHTRMDNAAA